MTIRWDERGDPRYTSDSRSNVERPSKTDTAPNTADAERARPCNSVYDAKVEIMMTRGMMKLEASRSAVRCGAGRRQTRDGLDCGVGDDELQGTRRQVEVA